MRVRIVHLRAPYKGDENYVSTLIDKVVKQVIKHTVNLNKNPFKKNIFAVYRQLKYYFFENFNSLATTIHEI